jgi:hypothetical protein
LVVVSTTKDTDWEWQYNTSPADVAAPYDGGSHANDPRIWPPSGTLKPTILDGDHVNPLCLSGDQAWKFALRGNCAVLSMEHCANGLNFNTADALHSNNFQQYEGDLALGDVQRFINKMVTLGEAQPNNGLSTTDYCLATIGNEYIAYQPDSGGFAVSLTAGTYAVEWWSLDQRKSFTQDAITVGDGNQSFTPPFSGPAGLYLKSTALTQ